MDFHGTTEHTLDAKHRLTVPSRYRAVLAGKVFLVKGVDPCVSVFPEETYSAMIKHALSGLNALSPEARKLRRFYSSNAELVELDSAGRVMVPRAHLQHAGIDRQAVIIGAGESLELWEPDAWAAYNSDLTAQAPELTQALGHPA